MIIDLLSIDTSKKHYLLLLLKISTHTSLFKAGIRLKALVLILSFLIKMLCLSLNPKPTLLSSLITFVNYSQPLFHLFLI